MTQTQVDIAKLASARNFLVQYLRDAGYNGSVDDGTAIHDTVIKPLALLLSVFQQQTDKAKAYLSIEEARALKETLGDEYDAVIDSILSNWFVERKDGRPASIQVRLYFSAPPIVIRFGRGVPIASADGINFALPVTTSFTGTQFTAHVNPLGGTEKYSIDLILTATGPGELTTNLLVSPPSFSVNSTRFTYGEALGVIDKGTIKEDSEQFIARTRQSITTRELISNRAISTVLPDSVNSVNDVYVAGYGAPEQIRDIHTFGGLTIHTGNKADIYVKTSIERVSLTKEIGPGGLVDLTGSGVLRVYAVTTTSRATLDYSVTGTSPELVNSLSCPYFLNVSGGTVGDTVLVWCIRTPSLVVADEFVKHEDNRVECYDPLVKEMFPIHLHATLYVNFTSDGILDKGLQTLLDAVQDTAIAYINKLGSQDIFRTSSFITHLHSRNPELLQVDTPVSCYYEIQDPLDMSIKTSSIVSKFALPVSLSAQVTDNTTQYYTDVYSINVLYNG